MAKFPALLCVAGLGMAPAWALNPVHDASVEFAPGLLEHSSQPSLMLGQFYTQESSQKIRALASYVHPLGPQFQVGVGAQSRWVDEPNNIRHLTAGLRYSLLPDFSLRADFLWGVANYAGDGLAVGGEYRMEPFNALHVLGFARVGFFDALVWDPDVAVLCASVTPRLILHQNFRLELEAFTATQFPGLGDFFSLDLAPALWIRFQYGFAAKAGVVFGLWGPNRSSPRFQLTQQIAF